MEKKKKKAGKTKTNASSGDKGEGKTQLRMIEEKSWGGGQLGNWAGESFSTKKKKIRKLHEDSGIQPGGEKKDRKRGDTISQTGLKKKKKKEKKGGEAPTFSGENQKKRQGKRQGRNPEFGFFGQ